MSKTYLFNKWTFFVHISGPRDENETIFRDSVRAANVCLRTLKNYSLRLQFLSNLLLKKFRKIQ